MKRNRSTVTEVQQQKELDFLYQVAQQVYSLDIDTLLSEIVDVAVKVTLADSCLIYVLDPTKKELVLRASKNQHPDLLEKIKMKLGEGITGWVAKEHKPVAIASGAKNDPRFKFFRNLPEDRFEAFLSVPIINKQGVVGVINVQHTKPHVHTPMEVNLLSAIGKLVGGAVENALLVEKTAELQEALEFRKTLDRAKGILMKQKKITEDEAFGAIQKASMESRMSMKEIAEAVIVAERLTG
jgi:uroporphyrinogen-III synthase